MRHRTAVALVIALVTLTFTVSAKRRSVRTGECAGPTLNLTVAPQTACPTEPVVVTWRASDRKAVVTIDGIGSSLSSTGSMRILDGQRSFTGFAVNSCGRGEDKTAIVNAPPLPAGSISASPASIKQYTTAKLRIDASNSAFWTLSSSLSNPIHPTSGFGDDEVTYTGANRGTDGILLRIAGQCDAATERVTSLVVEPGTQTPPPPPPPPPGFLRCCDNTFSPTCKSCTNKTGCCSGHGGVCSCG
jgi:hypothetical protein